MDKVVKLLDRINRNTPKAAQNLSKSYIKNTKMNRGADKM